MRLDPVAERGQRSGMQSVDQDPEILLEVLGGVVAGLQGVVNAAGDKCLTAVSDTTPDIMWSECSKTQKSQLWW